MMDRKIFLKELKESFITLKNEYKVLAIGIIAELSFLFLFVTFAIPFRNAIGNNLLQLGDFIVSQSQQQIGQNFLNDIFSTEYFRNILLLGTSLVLITYLLYCIFHGFIWRFCFNLTAKKGKYVPYIKKFFLVNLFWYPLFVFYIIINFFFSYIDNVGRRTDPSGLFFMENLSNLLLILIIYFAFISYVKIGENKVWKSIKESFRIGIKKFIWVLLMYIIIALVFIAINYLLVPIGNLHYILIIIIGSLIIIPLMLWVRIFIKRVVDAL